MLAQRRKRWPNIILQMGKCIWVVAFLGTGDEIVTPIAIAVTYLIYTECWVVVGPSSDTLNQH